MLQIARGTVAFDTLFLANWHSFTITSLSLQSANPALLVALLFFQKDQFEYHWQLVKLTRAENASYVIHEQVIIFFLSNIPESSESVIEHLLAELLGQQSLQPFGRKLCIVNQVLIRCVLNPTHQPRGQQVLLSL
mmetsp:Transcript_26815/g.44504  ORF Transcript_26815/g.44504 Transcript_26815/m.44504 type:complete len:135 (+) Transcript_26815:73-477(+)